MVEKAKSNKNRRTKYTKNGIKNIQFVKENNNFVKQLDLTPKEINNKEIDEAKSERKTKKYLEQINKKNAKEQKNNIDDTHKELKIVI